MKDISWTKNGVQLANDAHINVRLSRIKAGTWKSTLTINNVNPYDEGRYTLTAIAGKAKSSVEKLIYVAKQHRRTANQNVSDNKKPTASAIRFTTNLWAFVLMFQLCIFDVIPFR